MAEDLNEEDRRILREIISYREKALRCLDFFSRLLSKLKNLVIWFLSTILSLARLVLKIKSAMSGI